MYTKSQKSVSFLKALLVLVLVISVVFCAVPFQASAATTRTTTLDCTAFGANNSNTGEGWAWVEATKTLTLTDFHFKKGAGDVATGYGIKLPVESTIVLAGNNALEIFGTYAGIYDAALIHCEGLTIKGPGSLTLSADVDGTTYRGIHSASKGVTVTDGADVKINFTDSGISGGYPYGDAIELADNDAVTLTVTNAAKLTIHNPTEDATGLSLGNDNLLVSNGGVLETTGTHAGLYGYWNTVTIDNGTLTAKATDETAAWSAGMLLYDSVFRILNGSTVTASGSFGIFSETWFDGDAFTGGTIEIDNSTVSLDAPSGKAALYAGMIDINGEADAPTKMPVTLKKSVFVGRYPSLAMNKDMDILPPASDPDFMPDLVGYVFTATPEGKPFSYDVDVSDLSPGPSNVKNVANSVRIKPQSSTLVFNTNGGSAVASAAIAVDEPLAAHVDNKPTKEGYTFKGWYTDEALTTAAAPGTFYAPGMTLYAAWTKYNPQTGDSAAVWLVLAFLTMSIAGIGLVSLKKKKA